MYFRLKGGQAPIPTTPPHLPPINLPTIPDADDHDQQPAIFDVSDDSIVAHAVFPEGPQFRSFQGFANAARILKVGDAIMQEGKDATGNLGVYLAQFSGCCRVDSIFQTMVFHHVFQ